MCPAGCASGSECRIDRPLWRADLFDRHSDLPGTFGVAHFHPHFVGDEPCSRVWDPQLSEHPWPWLGAQFGHLGAVGGGEPWKVDVADAPELRQLGDVIVAIAKQFSPAQCKSSLQCFELTRDVRDALQMMLASLKRPDLLDESWLAPWRNST